jgi:hypothetical protein
MLRATKAPRLEAGQFHIQGRDYHFSSWLDSLFAGIFRAGHIVSTPTGEIDMPYVQGCILKYLMW